jgi:glyoxylase-like metal-dependent hydrolase (beta-lactamase superfamily II)
MRALAVHPDVIVVVSGFWQTTATFVRAGDEGFLIDSPVLTAELEALPSLAQQAGFPVSGLLATHGDWDHLLGRLAFPEASLGVGELTAARLEGEPGEAQRRLRRFDEEWYIERPGPLQLAGVQALPVPGRLDVGSGENAGELELHPLRGHTSDGVAYLLQSARVLICGDYLSPVEIPMITAKAGGDAFAYMENLTPLAALVEQAETVVPGHGTPLPRERALTILEEDRAYLDALLAGREARLPEGRRSSTQQQIHKRNLASLPGA